jgi:hypothetical protein
MTKPKRRNRSRVVAAPPKRVETLTPVVQEPVLTEEQRLSSAIARARAEAGAAGMVEALGGVPTWRME